MYFIFWALLVFGILLRLDLLESIEQVKSKAEILDRAEEKDYEAQLYFLDWQFKGISSFTRYLVCRVICFPVRLIIR